jgi:di/tricarboxylate transporter
MWLALGILGTAILLFVTEWLRVDVVALGVVVALMLSGLLSATEALAGFANPAVLTIASLFVVGGAVMQTGLAGAIGQRILSIAGTNQARLTAIIMGAVAILSAFMSDTGTVAVLLPAIVSLAHSSGISPSKLLIPLSFGALLGGSITLIGTPPNLIISDLLRQEGLTAFGFFDYTPIGLTLLVVGILFMLSAGRHLLPDRQPTQEVQRVATPEELVALYRLPDDLFRLRVRRNSGLVGKTVPQSRLGTDFRVSVLEVLRPPQPRPVAKLGRARMVPEPESLQAVRRTETVLAADDILVVKGQAGDVVHAAASWNLGVQPAQAQDQQALVRGEVGLAEVLLPPRSSLEGKTLVEAQFGTVHKLTVLDIQRPGTQDRLDLKQTALQFGDILLVQGPWQNILALKERRRDFVVMGAPEAMVGAPARRKAPVALAILVAMLALMVANAVPVVTASMLAGLGMILGGCLTIDDGYEAVDWKSIVLIACMLPMSTALEKVGLVNVVAEGLIGALGSWGPLAVLAGLFLLSSVFTQVLSNTATTVLVAPIALVAARKLGVQPQAFMMGVAIAASMAFASPVASPVNTLVMGAGRYRFGDYVKIGTPLMFLALMVTVLILPLLWPL